MVVELSPLPDPVWIAIFLYGYLPLLLVSFGVVIASGIHDLYFNFRLSAYLRKHYRQLWEYLGYDWDGRVTLKEIASRRLQWIEEGDNDAYLRKVKTKCRNQKPVSKYAAIFLGILLLLPFIYIVWRTFR